MLTTRTLSLAILIGSPLVSCHSVSSAPEESPRIEAELMANLDDSMAAALDADQEELDQLARDTIYPKADMSLRLYPVWSDDYDDGYDHPAYNLSIDVRDFHPLIKSELIKDATTDESRISTQVEYLVCVVRASFYRRRENAPALLVGTALGSSKVRAGSNFESGEVTYNLRHGANAGVPLAVKRSDVALAVRLALVEALQDLTIPMDREFQLMQVGAPTRLP